jgi:hypothetical protein
MTNIKTDQVLSAKKLENPNDYAIPLVASYLANHTQGMDERERVATIVSIGISSISADWEGLIRVNPEKINEYLKNVIEILKETTGKEHKNALSQPIFSVLEKIENIPEGGELYGEICQEVVQMCQEDVELTRLSRFLSSGGEYQEFDETLDI